MRNQQWTLLETHQMFRNFKKKLNYFGKEHSRKANNNVEVIGIAARVVMNHGINQTSASKMRNTIRYSLELVCLMRSCKLNTSALSQEDIQSQFIVLAKTKQNPAKTTTKAF